LIVLLKDIFYLEEVGDLNSTRWKIGEYIKKMSSPIWSLKYYSKLEPIKRFSDGIFKLTRSPDTEINREDIRTLCDLIKENKFDIISHFKDIKIFSAGFSAFLMSIEKTNVAEYEVKEIMEYLHENLQEEVSTWEEDKVKSIVKDWRLEKNQKESNGPLPVSQSIKPPYAGEPPSPGSTASNQGIYRKKVIQKIKSYNGSLNSIKQILIKMIEDNPTISSIIERYF
jgi:hypothetical protein